MEATFRIVAELSHQQMVLYAGAACLIMFLTIRMRRKAREQTGAAPYESRERLAHMSAARGVRGDMEDLLAELQELARSINAQIDTKFAKLEASIQDADRRIAELKRLNGRNGDPPPTPNGRLDLVVGDDAAPPLRRPEREVSDRHARVYELHDAGKSPVEIAQTLGQTPGEIELILSLRPR